MKMREVKSTTFSAVFTFVRFIHGVFVSYMFGHVRCSGELLPAMRAQMLIVIRSIAVRSHMISVMECVALAEALRWYNV